MDPILHLRDRWINQSAWAAALKQEGALTMDYDRHLSSRYIEEKDANMKFELKDIIQGFYSAVALSRSDNLSIFSQIRLIK